MNNKSDTAECVILSVAKDLWNKKKGLSQLSF